MTTAGQTSEPGPGSPAGGAGGGSGARAVVLWALPALYARGLGGALTQGGHAPVAVHQGQAPPPAAAPIGDRATVVVAAAEVLADLEDLAVLGGVAVAVVAVVARATVETFAAELARGAAGVLDPTAGLKHAVQVVAAAGAGLVVVPDHLARALASRALTAGAPPLGPGERAWLRWLGSGGTVATLAAHACRSEREMYRALNELYARLGASGRTQALLAAQRWGLLDE